MRTTIGYVLQSIGFLIAVQGLLGCVSQSFFDTHWGWLHHLASLSSAAYLGITVLGAAIAVGGAMTLKGSRAAAEAA
ncbi:hypothetical protein [Streptomyces sp. bgisy100]|uniref:hypothetical protein n=1 Tax=Streptomyces sp. bgisy100 TaxID=3413783 RepID=UPI003D72A718